MGDVVKDLIRHDMVVLSELSAVRRFVTGAVLIVRHVLELNLEKVLGIATL